MTTPDAPLRVTPDQLPIGQLKKMLCNQIHQISQQDRQEVHNYALQHIPGRKLITSGDGTRLSLDATIPDEVIIGMHALIQSKMCFYDEVDFKR